MTLPHVGLVVLAWSCLAVLLVGACRRWLWHRDPPPDDLPPPTRVISAMDWRK